MLQVSVLNSSVVAPDSLATADFDSYSAGLSGLDWEVQIFSKDHQGLGDRVN